MYLIFSDFRLSEELRIDDAFRKQTPHLNLRLSSAILRKLNVLQVPITFCLVDAT